MPSKLVSKDLNDGIYFVTITTKHWYYIFDRHDRWEILVESLNYCSEHKNLKVYSFVFMFNHIHLIIQSPDVSGFLRDFKKYTALMIMKNLRETEPRVADLFQDKDGKFQIWRKTNMPIILETEKVFLQKQKYIEENPVKKNYVKLPEHWVYSSASGESHVICCSIFDE